MIGTSRWYRTEDQLRKLAKKHVSDALWRSCRGSPSVRYYTSYVLSHLWLHVHVESFPLFYLCGVEKYKSTCYRLNQASCIHLCAFFTHDFGDTVFLMSVGLFYLVTLNNVYILLYCNIYENMHASLNCSRNLKTFIVLMFLALHAILIKKINPSTLG